MSSVGDKTVSVRRAHDAGATRLALLEAGGQVFEEVGYDRATTREIGERAGVDPALIARYFGGKEGLFLAAIAVAAGEEEEIDFEPRALLAFLLGRWDDRGPSPISRALASPSLSEDVRLRISAIVRERVLVQLEGELRGRGVAEPGLRAELLVAMALGIAMTRSNGTLETLSAASREQVLAAMAPMVDALASG